MSNLAGIVPSLSNAFDASKAFSKYEASFAKSYDAEPLLQESDQMHPQSATSGPMDRQQVRSAWEPAPARPSTSRTVQQGSGQASPAPSQPIKTASPLTGLKSSRNWEPSPPPPPPKLVPTPSPGPLIPVNPLRSTATSRQGSKAPWEPSPPPVTGPGGKRAQSPVKSLISSPLKTEIKVAPGSATTNKSDSSPVDRGNVPRLAMKIAAPVAQAPPPKKGWDTINVAATPIEDQLREAGVALKRTDSGTSSVFPSTPLRRDSIQSAATSFADIAVGRSRANSLLPSTTGLEQSSGLSRRGSITSPGVSRSSTPSAFGPSITSALNDTPGGASQPSASKPVLKSFPSVSSPLATLKTGKSLRIVSTASNAQVSPLAESPTQVAYQRTVAAPLASPVDARKSVPASSVRKSKEQRAAERKEKADKANAAKLAAEMEAAQLESEKGLSSAEQEVAPIVARARKQKQKAPVVKPSKAAASTLSSPTSLRVQTDAAPGALDETETHAQAKTQPKIVKDPEPGIEKPVVPPAHPDDAASAGRLEAMDIVQQLAAEMDLTRLQFFTPDNAKSGKSWSHMSRHGGYVFSDDEWDQAAQLLPAPGSGRSAVLAAAANALGISFRAPSTEEGLSAEQYQKTVEHLERVLQAARKDADGSEKRFEKMQRKNMRTVGLGSGMLAS